MTTLEEGYNVVTPDPKVSLRAATLREAAFRAGEDAAESALNRLRTAFIQAGIESYGTFNYENEDERREFRELAKARFNIVGQTLLEDL